MTTRSGKADRSTVRLSVLSAISPPCSDLATMGLGQSNAGLARAHLQPRSFSTAGHNLDNEHNLLIELNRRSVVKNLGRSRPDHPAGDGSRVFVKRKPHLHEAQRWPRPPARPERGGSGSGAPRRTVRAR